MNARPTKTIAMSWLLLLCVACGGGGSKQAAPGNPQPPQPPVNHAPEVANPNPQNLRAVTGHPFSHDALQGGTTFRDPDGDPLVFWMVVHGQSDLGLTWSETTISGTLIPPISPGWILSVEIWAEDSHGIREADSFNIQLAENSAPAVVRENPAKIVVPGAGLDYDVTQGGTTFADIDGDAIAYEITVIPDSRGITVSGTRINGAFTTVGAVLVKVAAMDFLGAAGEDQFIIAAPAPAPGAPSLPVTSYVYEDDDQTLPYLYRLSRESLIPFWDQMPRNDNETTNAGATLGRVLFYDKRLSITNTHSCASCHQQAFGFADPKPFSAGVVGESTRRNAMGLTNVRYNVLNLHFSDDRVEGLENLTLLPIQDDLELASPMELVEGKLRGTTFYPPLFDAAFGTPEINRDRIAKALAQFLRSLYSYRAKFDRAYHVMNEGDFADPATVLAAQEIRGFDVYVESKCAHCHQNDVHVTIAHNNGLDLVPVDPGAGRGRFRPASLRNVAKTGPYMHDGRFATLREVIDFYDQGIQASPGLSPILSPLGQPLRLNLSEDDKLALEAFLLTLTDDEFLAAEKFSNPFP